MFFDKLLFFAADFRKSIFFISLSSHKKMSSFMITTSTRYRYHDNIIVDIIIQRKKQQIMQGRPLCFRKNRITLSINICFIWLIMVDGFCMVNVERLIQRKLFFIYFLPGSSFKSACLSVYWVQITPPLYLCVIPP